MSVIDRITNGIPCPPNKEMVKFRDMLDEYGATWRNESDGMFCRTKSNKTVTVTLDDGKTYERELFSVICGEHSYGGADGLEAWFPWQSDPRGYDTAEQVMRLVRKAVSWDGRSEVEE